MAKNTKTYRPAPFVPNTSYTGTEPPLLISGENMWLRYSRSGSMYAEGYSGSQALSSPEDSIPLKLLTGTISWDATTKTVTGSSTLFKSEAYPGEFVLGYNSADGQSELFCIEEIADDTHFTCSEYPSTTKSGKVGYVMPVIYGIGLDRGTSIRGNVIRYFKGHYLGVGDGEFRINGNSLSTTFNLSKTPQFALYDPVTDTYTIDDVGINTPILPPTISAISIVAPAITSVNDPAGPALVEFTISAAEHGLFTGDKIHIAGYSGTLATITDGEYTITRTSATKITIGVVGTGTGAHGAGGTLTVDRSQMRAGDYNIRICARNTETIGFSQPTNVIAPVTLTNNQSIKIVFNSAMFSDQNAYDIYSSEFVDNSTSTVEARYQGPWYRIRTVTADQLVLSDTGITTGTEAGSYYIFNFSDAEINSAQDILTFDNFNAVDAGCLDLINGIPIYFSCLGKGTPDRKTGTSPGPVAIPSKGLNPEAVLLDKAITTANGDYILGEFNLKSRIFALCQNSLQTIILTTIDEEPIAFRSLWNCGFRNPFNVAFVKEYLYGFSTQKLVRSVAGGDDTAEEFDFASDIYNLTANIPCGHALMAYDPKNRAMCLFHSAAEKNASGYWVTKVYPWLVDKQIWNPPITLEKANADFIVSGVATIGENLVFLAGGRTSTPGVTVGTYIFDGGNSETKAWNLVWNYSDDGIDINAKTIKGAAITGRFANDTNVNIFGVKLEDDIDTSFITPDSTITFSNPSSTAIKRRRYKMTDSGPYSLYAMQVSGSYTTTVDRIDELLINMEINNSDA